MQHHQHPSPTSLSAATCNGQQPPDDEQIRNGQSSGTRGPETYGHGNESTSNNNSNSNNSISGRNNGSADVAGSAEEGLFSEKTTDNSSSCESGNTATGGLDVGVSVVGSPEMYGTSSSYHPAPALVTTATATAITSTPESDDERATDRCDILNQQQTSTANSSQNQQPSSATGSATTADSRPPKKRFIQMSDVPRIRTLHNQLSAFVEPLKPAQFPSGEQFQQAMNQWEWSQVDGLKMPVVFRGQDRYAAVHIVQLKLLSKFPPNIPPEMTNKFMMISHKMLPIEAWIFNTINAVICKFDLGCQLFTPNDEIVRLIDVEQFYWSVKALNLSRMIEIYSTELRTTTSTHLMAAITQMRNHVETDLKVTFFS